MLDWAKHKLLVLRRKRNCATRKQLRLLFIRRGVTCNTYQVHLHGARRVLGPEAQTILTPAPGQYLNWLTHLRAFYKVILDHGAYQEKLQQRGILGEALLAAQQQIEQIPQLKHLQMQAAEARRLANQTSRLQQQALHDWYRELTVVASLAFRHQPTLLASLRPALPRTKRTARNGTISKKKQSSLRNLHRFLQADYLMLGKAIRRFHTAPSEGISLTSSHR